MWMPVGQYTGGVEHAILHLLYSRFFTKVLHDMGLVSFTEPFPRLMNQGQVIYDGASMSKSKGNLVEPMPIVERWGADTMRLIILFAGPFQDDIDWKLIAGDDPTSGPACTRGSAGCSTRWTTRSARTRPRARRAAAGDRTSREGRDRGPRAVPVQHGDLEAAGADERDAVGARRRRRSARGRDRASRCCWRRSPRSPPRSSGARSSATPRRVHRQSWPTFDPSLVVEDTVTLVIQVNGKVRDRVEVPAGADDASVLELARASERAQRAIGDGRVVKEIVRAPKLVNLVVQPA